MSVETLPSFLEVLLRGIFTPEVVPASEWILGLRDLFQTILLFYLRSEILIIHPFLALILLLH